MVAASFLFLKMRADEFLKEKNKPKRTLKSTAAASSSSAEQMTPGEEIYGDGSASVSTDEIGNQIYFSEARKHPRAAESENVNQMRQRHSGETTTSTDS